MNDTLLFGVLPYVSLVVFFLVTIRRYRMRAFSYSSLSSQFLENRHHFWGSVPFHYGILVVLGGHVLAFLFPRTILSWNAAPVRLLMLEITGLGFALLTLVGLANLILRRWLQPKVRRVTNFSDWVVYALLVVQVVSGIWIAVAVGWGSSWFATSLTPWLWSLVTLSPRIELVSALPLPVKLHVLNAFLLIGVFPFTRLVHVLVVPNQYLLRKTQVVLWNAERTRGVEPR